MKEICIPFAISLPLTQTDVHWVEAQLLEQRTRIFLDVLHRVIAHIEAAVVAGAVCPECSGPLKRNGRVLLVLETLLGRLEYARQRLRCPRCSQDVYPTLQRAYLPEAVVVLDPWHLAQALQRVGGAEARGLIGRCLQDAWRGDVRRLLHRVRARVAHGRDPGRRAEGQGLIGYIQVNAVGIANLARLEATGSGATEKTVDVLVSHKYKKRGMSWGRSGSGALLRLRLLKANGEWEAYWQRRRDAFARRVA